MCGSCDQNKDGPAFLISSAFPFKKESLFFPRPMMRIGREGEDDPKKGKQLKKVRFISKGLFEASLKGNPPEFHADNTFQNGMCWTDRQMPESARVFSKREVPRVTLDRRTFESDIFYFSEVLFEKDAGLFFLVRFWDQRIRPRFEAVLRLLGDEGIGGDKRIGRGLFSVTSEDNFTLSVPKNPDGFLSLSLYFPTESEFDSMSDKVSYNLLSRKGWIHSFGAMSLKRQSVRMFAEGSVFNLLGRPPYGASPCVLRQNREPGLKHDIYRYGFAFDIPVLKREET
ncbi:MAG: type III-A CRISPR-associated RAMP protein Csm4 [Desulfobacteraceae bacterium 4572_88]|nr:MAG: type III-A CRISPR-associated RAMP protein Csm4 [Desulfobacteraceae bacterium 4572_88]